MGTAPEEAVFVGDNLEADIRGAQNAGMMAVWRMPAAPNGDTPAPDVTPDGTITTLHDLLPLLDGGIRAGATGTRHDPAGVDSYENLVLTGPMGSGKTS
ncbi:MAG: HAD hydrolase-like protein [Anaerolineae bacterium]|nr:HAD hydrolase-like protein [Anaerolineae bacterium]